MIFSKILRRIPHLLFIGLSFFYHPVAEAQTLKIASLAPDGSSWVKALRSIDQQIREQTSGTVQLKIYPGGVQGDEKVVLRKMRIGQLHGAGFAGQGVSQIFPDVLAVQMPFLFNNYEEIDHVLANMDTFFKEAYAERGYIHLGWSEIGFVHILSKSPIRGVSDIRQHKVWRLEEEPITDVLFNLAKVTSVPLTIPDVLLGLQTNLIDVVYASPAAAIVLQWFTKVKYINKLPINYTLGAFLIDAKAFSRLAPEHQILLRQIAEKEMNALSLTTRRENEEAIQAMLANGLEQIEANEDELQTLYDLVEQTRLDLVGNAFSQVAHDRVEQLLIEYRQHTATVRP